MQDFVTGTLPNVMFIVGVIAIGIGLGFEFKLIEVKGQVTKSGRIGALGLGAVLIAVSVFLYARPNLPGTAASDVSPQTAAVSQAAVVADPGAVAPPPAPTEAPIPATATAIPPTETAVPPTETAAPTAIAGVMVPDIRAMNPKDARKTLEALGLRLGDKQDNCDVIGVQAEEIVATDRDRIMCQAAAPGSVVPPNSQVHYVVAGGKNGGGDDDDDDDG